MGITSGSQFGLYLALGRAGTSNGYNFIFEAVEVTSATGSLALLLVGMLGLLALIGLIGLLLVL
jgi:hypothetical protein